MSTAHRTYSTYPHVFHLLCKACQSRKHYQTQGINLHSLLFMPLFDLDTRASHCVGGSLRPALIDTSHNSHENFCDPIAVTPNLSALAKSLMLKVTTSTIHLLCSSCRDVLLPSLPDPLLITHRQREPGRLNISLPV